MRVFAVLTAVAAAAAFFTPLWATEPARAAGVLLVSGAVVELLQGFRRRTPAAQRSAWTSGALTLMLALLILNAAWIATTALSVFVAVPFALDALRYARMAVRQIDGRESPRRAIGSALGNLAVVVGIVLVGRYASGWVIGAAAGMRLLATTFNLLSAPVYFEGEADESVIADIGLDDPKLLAETGARLQREERSRTGADRGWVAALIVVLFAIHISRMGFDRSALGILSPLVAVIGDMVVALGLAYAVIVPVRLSFRRLTRVPERRAWSWVLGVPPQTGVRAWPARVTRAWLESRMRLAIRLRSTRYSLGTALDRGLQIGLPLAAIIVASVPVWGMSWYFDTENWAAGIWNSWAAARTDTWRESMAHTVVDAGLTTLDGQGFAVSPPGLRGGEPFSFIVIGDTGEGDASQHILRDSLIRAAGADDVRFVVLSSDVIYPTGAMRDYELKFWLPFKGVTKPVYAIPGNHDWYDALEGFVATFFEPRAARLAMLARIEADQGLSSTTDAVIDADIAQAALLRRQYGVPTGFQQGPFFQVQTPDFALVAVDTGVLRRVDAAQLAWLDAALEASRGKMVMAVLGHPFFAGGRDVSAGDEGFTAIRDLLRKHDVRIVMAGDTHDFEYYVEPVQGPAGPVTVHHWVNGGGGAYLSFGTALDWPADPVTNEWAYYPGHADVVSKIQRFTPWWKWPAWVWTRDFGAWPSTPEWLSAMFDYNVAPFFQSFVVVTVDPAGRRVTFQPWGVSGPLTWRDLDRSPGATPQGVTPDQPVEWVVHDEGR